MFSKVELNVLSIDNVQYCKSCEFINRAMDRGGTKTTPEPFDCVGKTMFPDDLIEVRTFDGSSAIRTHILSVWHTRMCVVEVIAIAMSSSNYS